MATRPESDSLGNIDVPADAYWGAQTQRSIHNFPFPPHERMPLPIIHALATIKCAAARVNRRHGLDAGIADAIENAAQEVMRGVGGRVVGGKGAAGGTWRGGQDF